MVGGFDSIVESTVSTLVSNVSFYVGLQKTYWIEIVCKFCKFIFLTVIF